MKICYPDYKNSIANLACSILKEFGVAGGTEVSLKMCDELLQKKYKNIVILLLDGMGKCIMDGNLSKEGFFAKHLVGTYSSVFPPTTVAATTSILCGKNPVEHSWLGWDCYYKEINKNVTVFLNTESGTDRPAADFNVPWTYCPYNGVVEQIRAAGGQAYYATPFVEPHPGDFKGICARIKELCEMDGKKYVYGYWNEPDYTMHRKGCFHEDSKAILVELEKTVQELCDELEDTLVIVTADHGHMDSVGVAIEEYPELLQCLVRLPSIEPRALNLYVKEGMHQQFEELFRKEFGEKFLLLTKAEVRAQQLFGIGEEHPRFDEMLGDYLAVAIDDLTIYNTTEEKEYFIGVHAGLTEEEMIIPFIAINCPGKVTEDI